MPDESREFEPLMLSIEQVLTALDDEPLRQSLSQSLQTAATELRSMFEDFDNCCCRSAHVVPVARAARVQAKQAKKATKSKKAKARKKVKSVSARSRRR